MFHISLSFVFWFFNLIYFFLFRTRNGYNQLKYMYRFDYRLSVLHMFGCYIIYVCILADRLLRSQCCCQCFRCANLYFKGFGSKVNLLLKLVRQSLTVLTTSTMLMLKMMLIQSSDEELIFSILFCFLYFREKNPKMKPASMDSFWQQLYYNLFFFCIRICIIQLIIQHKSYVYCKRPTCFLVCHINLSVCLIV